MRTVSRYVIINNDNSRNNINIRSGPLCVPFKTKLQDHRKNIQVLNVDIGRINGKIAELIV